MRLHLARWGERLLKALFWILITGSFSTLLTRDVYVPPLDTDSRVQAYLRAVEFDFVWWTVRAVGFKLRQASAEAQPYLTEAERSQTVRDYFDLRRRLEQTENEIAARYADPTITDPASATTTLREREADLLARLKELQPLAEAILQEQVSTILIEQGFGVGGQLVPPVSAHFTALPLAFIVSPRTEIRQVVNRDVEGDLTLDQRVALEDVVARGVDVSTLIVPLGGIGTYPAMIADSSDLNWIAAVVAHEWAHNYLFLRPLGLNYLTTPELRTMNETTAEMFGNEIGAQVIARYYPELVPPRPPFNNFMRRDFKPTPEATPSFDFRAEMHTTRVIVDELLEAGKVEEAETYLETRRRFFWEHGYQFRKLNQAYFAFYGAYAASAGEGATGADPVGPAVRLLRRQSPTLKAFIESIESYDDFSQLQERLGLRGQ